MKIIAGSLGGRVLATPRGRLVRPTTGRVREALFQRLGPLDGGAALDLFAGSGALGFEALSRGAATCLFADTAAASIACLRANVKHYCMFHHEPVYDDATLYDVLQETIRYEEIMREGASLQVSTAYDGLVLHL